jgi:hypothetical protein
MMRRTVGAILFAGLSWAVIQFALWSATFKPTVIDGGDLLGAIVLSAYVVLVVRVVRQTLPKDA